MTESVRKKIVLNAYPDGMPKPSDWKIVEEAVPPVADGEFLVQTLYLGLEPRLRLMMNPTTDDNKAMRPHGAMTDIGRVMPGTVLGKVVVSKNNDYPVGSVVEGFMGWQTHIVTDGKPHPTNNPEGVALCDTTLAAPVEFIGPLGAPGMTAWLAHKHEAKLEPGETMVVTSAAGMVGCLAGQLGKHYGARVVGLTSTDEKVRYLTDTLGFDVGINYRTTDNLGDAIAAACPDGVDYYFDNTGGPMAQTICDHLSPRGRVTRCGIVAHYNETKPWGQAEQFSGQFSVHNHVPEYAEARSAMAQLLKDDAIQYECKVFDGLEETPQAFIDLLSGKNIGKFVVKVADA